VDTLLALSEVEPGTSLYFILGIDTYREIHTWRDAARIFEIANLVVTNRPGYGAEPSITHLPVAAREAFCYDPATRSYRHQSGTTLRFLSITGLDISATEIRARLQRGDSVRYLLPSEVERYIREKRLYSGAAID
jgi:nicotinate-nucleotide adenylyltransferase